MDKTLMSRVTWAAVLDAAPAVACPVAGLRGRAVIAPTGSAHGTRVSASGLELGGSALLTPRPSSSTTSFPAGDDATGLPPPRTPV